MELLVAVAIGVLIITAMSLLFANNSRTRSETERASQKIENGRFAVDVIGSDLHHAGYFSMLDPRLITAPAAMPDPCISPVGAASALTIHVQGVDNATDGSPLASGCITDVRGGSDVLVIRRASGCVAGAAGCPSLGAGAPGFQVSSCNDGSRPELATGDVANYFRLSVDAADFDPADAAKGRTKRDCTTKADVLAYVQRIYFIAKNDMPGDGIPTLKRAELRAGGFTTVSLVQGVENLQVEWGVDTNNDGNPDVYTAAPGSSPSCDPATPSTCVTQWTSVVAAKVYVLARNVDPSPGYSDSRSYELGRNSDGSVNTVAATNDSYKRSVFQETIRLQNVSGRRFSPS